MRFEVHIVPMEMQIRHQQGFVLFYDCTAFHYWINIASNLKMKQTIVKLFFTLFIKKNLYILISMGDMKSLRIPVTFIAVTCPWFFTSIRPFLAGTLLTSWVSTTDIAIRPFPSCLTYAYTRLLQIEIYFILIVQLRKTISFLSFRVSLPKQYVIS